MIWPALLIIFGISLVIKRGNATFFWKECCGFRKRKVKDDKEKRQETIMANATIDTSELEYLKSCRDKLRDKRR